MNMSKHDMNQSSEIVQKQVRVWQISSPWRWTWASLLTTSGASRSKSTPSRKWSCSRYSTPRCLKSLTYNLLVECYFMDLLAQERLCWPEPWQVNAAQKTKKWLSSCGREQIVCQNGLESQRGSSECSLIRPIKCVQVLYFLTRLMVWLLFEALVRTRFTLAS